MTSHLDALQIRLSHERSCLARAKTAGERKLRSVWIGQIEKEIAGEMAHLGIDAGASAGDMTDDELLAALST